MKKPRQIQSDTEAGKETGGWPVSSLRKIARRLSWAYMAVLVYFGIRLDPADIREAFRVSMIYGARLAMLIQKNNENLLKVLSIPEWHPSHPKNVKYKYLTRTCTEATPSDFYDTELGIPFNNQNRRKKQ